ncbi:hypothetical protein NYQ10_14890 [Flavobacterium johnsoniae]|uniref:MauE/DoxX family redox-associated membrane protein n=1 Tax=Flavobacterium johnsoniae TaxID=986 RepID=UPI0025B0CFB6|nr:MauE/DoxX family redox-associated membrane protein [Flavobacterium johnsoniae]WJS93378.1 hypothetical protein NYQ10_14890 [Flavobacterium johnsoniae]
MKLRFNFKSVFIEVVSLLFILLFVYAAITKLLDFENFQVQLGQSPLLSAYASWVSWLVPIIELVIATALIIPKCRTAALIASLGMMTMFSVYIIIILNYSSFVPCSCGGILEKMNWKEHLVFNLFFVLLAVITIMIMPVKKEFNAENRIFNFEKKHKYISLLSSIFLAVGIMFLLFIKSESTMKFDNSFIRRFAGGTEKIYEKNLYYNSFYFAGAVEGKIYLGNRSAPLIATELDTALVIVKYHTIKVNDTAISKSAQLRINQSGFYLIDGSISSVFRGKMLDWKAKIIRREKLRFTQPQVVDSLNISFRTIDQSTDQSELGSLFLGYHARVSIQSDLLQKQVDGMFDVDGKLYYDYYSKRHVYIYTYRNEFIVSDSKLNLIYRSNTIDTVRMAKIKVAFIKSRGVKKLAAPPLVVNKYGAVCHNLLFINSNITGRYEDRKMWNQAAVIDVYNLKNKSYISSFYVYNIKDEKLKSFYVKNDIFYALIGTHLTAYRLGKIIKNQYNN